MRFEDFALANKFDFAGPVETKSDLRKAKDLEERYFQLLAEHLDLKERLRDTKAKNDRLAEEISELRDMQIIGMNLAHQTKAQIQLFKKQVFKWFSLHQEAAGSDGEKVIRLQMTGHLLEEVFSEKP